MTKQSQIDRFKETARHLGVDESEAVFDEKLKALAEQKHECKGPKNTAGAKGE